MNISIPNNYAITYRAKLTIGPISRAIVGKFLKEVNSQIQRISSRNVVSLAKWHQASCSNFADIVVFNKDDFAFHIRLNGCHLSIRT